MHAILKAPAAIGGCAVGRAFRLGGTPAAPQTANVSGCAPAPQTADASVSAPVLTTTAEASASVPAFKAIANSEAVSAPALTNAETASVPDSAAKERAGSPEGEKARFAAAVEAVKAELAVLAADDSPAGAVFAAHLEMLEDPLLEEQVEAALEEGCSAPEAVDAAAEAVCAMFSDIDDEYLRSRMDDVRDICRRIRERLTVSAVPARKHACGAEEGGCMPAGTMPAGDADEGIILIADELFPSDLARMDFARVRAFVTARGSVTSHVCIIARSKGIPALLGVEISAIPEGARLLVDAPSHRLVIDPASEDLAVLAATHDPSAPLRRIPLYGNAGSVEDVRAAMEAGADGIGVFRTELMFMQSATLPTEEEQFAAYREAALICKGKPLIIRTLDIGGDKPLPYLDLPREDNPYLGFRAIRLCLDRPEELFKPQLRALLRASAYGDVRILLPMVISVGEVRAVRDLLEECKRELDAEAVEGRKREPDANAAVDGLPAAPDGRSARPYNPAIPVGIMVETPAAALIAEDLAQEADFFSLGTNDLTQYILAADRGNPAVARYYDSLHPAVLRAIAMTVAAAHGDARPDTPGAGRRIPVCVCGEMAADPAAAEKLLALGVDSLSLSSPSGIAALKCRMGTGT